MMFKFVALVALLAAVASAGTLPKNVFAKALMNSGLSGKIINGEETTIEAIPYQISLRYHDDHHCGGSIISENWVLTAAHCLGGTIDFYTVLAGTADKYNEKSTGTVHKVDGIFKHANFVSTPHIIDDIALVHVVEPFQFDETRQPIKLFNQDEESVVGSLALISGWGNTGTEYPQILNRVEIPIISKQKCKDQYSQYGGIADGQICAAYEEGGKDSCQQDSGGPLSIDGRLAGIVSWGQGCGVAGQPGVYTEVAWYRDWVHRISNV